MKKLLSTVLAVAMLMTVILAVPAQAAPSAEYPYVFVDFEDGTLGPNEATGNAAIWVAGGAGGSRGAEKVAMTGTATGQGGLYIPVNIPVNIGDKFAVSAWVKFDLPVVSTSKKIGFHARPELTYTSNSGGEPIVETVSWNEKIDCSSQYALNEWIFVSGEISADASDFAAKEGYTLSSIVVKQVRPYAGSVSGTNDIDKELAPDATAFTYYMDDISYAKVEAATTAIGVKNIAKDDLINGDFESFTANANIITRSGAGWGFTSYNYAAKAKKYSDSDPRPAGMAATSNTYMHVPLTIEDGRNNTSAAVGYGYSELFIDQYGATTNHMLELKPGHTYKVDFWVRANGDNTCTVAKYNPVFVQTVGILSGGVVDEAQSIPVDVNGFRNSAGSQVKEYIMDGIEVVTNGGWQHVEYYLQFDHKASTSRPMPINLQLRPVGGSGTKILGASFDYDEIQILDMGPLANGDFEIGETANVRYYWAGKNTNTTQSVLGWTPSLADGLSLDKPNATLSQADEVRPGTTGTKSMKVAVTANGGSLYRAVGLENGKQYKISFWAKGNNMATNMYMMVVLNRTGTVADNESYTMPTTQYIWGADPAQIGTSQPPLVQRWKVTNEWQKYEFVYDNTFPLKEGLTQANAYTFPKVPWLQLNMLNTSAANIPAGTEFFLDDFQIEEIATGAPAALEVAVTGNATPDTEVAADYSFAAKGATDASYVKLLAKVGNNYASLGTYAANAAITVPEAAIGKELALEIVPVGSNGKVGDSVIVPIAAAGNWAKIYVDAETLASRAYASEAKTAKVLYAAYTTDGETKKLVSSGMADATIAANTKFDVAVPEDFSIEGADTVKVMLWDGLTNVTPLCEFVEVPVQ